MLLVKLVFVASIAAFGCSQLFGAEVSQIKDIKISPLIDHGRFVQNPGMGWVAYYYANSLKYYAEYIDGISDEQLTSFPGLSVAMFRLDWSHLEPQEMKYQWELIDKPAERFYKLGWKIAIRVANSENFAGQPYATPKWVFDAGAKEVRFRPGYPGVFDPLGANREPDFGDPIFFKKLDNFLKRLAAKYDDPTKVAFVDVGSFGVYGEGHTWSSTKKGYPEDVLKKHIDIYRKYFKKVPILANHNFADHLQDGRRNWKIIQYAADNNLGFRDDSLLIDKGKRAFYDEKMADLFCGRGSPIVLETGEYSTRVAKGYWEPEKIIEAIKAYHANYIGAYWYPLSFYRENKSLVERVNRMIGYRLTIENPNIVPFYDGASISFDISNSGVSDIPVDAFSNLSIYNERNGVAIFSGNSLANIRTKISKCRDGDQKLTENFSVNFSGVPLGEYLVCVRINAKNMQISMPYDRTCPQGGYKIGKFKLVKQ